MKTPLVTVLMPNHNGEKTIAASIESVLSQTYTDFELLIVEDASTDQSLKKIEQFADERIRVLRLQQNEHICLALNLGLAEAKGKYIARIDSDDCWLPEKLEKQIAYMEEHPKCGACFTWVNVIDENDRVLTENESMFVKLFHQHNRPRLQWIHDFFLHGSCLCHPSAVFPLSVARELGGYRNSLVQIQDFDLWIRISRKWELHIIEEALMNYRHALHGGNVSETSPENNIRTYYEMYNVIGQYFDNLSDDVFRVAFRQEFVRKEAQEHNELLCEKALLLLNPIFCGHASKIKGMDLLATLLDHEETRLILREKYGITQMNYYELTRSNVLLLEDPSTAVYQLERAGMFNMVSCRNIVEKFSLWEVFKLRSKRCMHNLTNAKSRKAHTSGTSRE